MLNKQKSEQLIKSLNKEVDLLNKRASSYDYYESEKVSDIIYDVVDKIDKHLLLEDTEAAIAILQKLISIDEKLFDHIDDSYGNLGTAYYYLFEILDKFFAHSSWMPAKIAAYIIDIYVNDVYGNRTNILRLLKTALVGDAALELNKIIQKMDIDEYATRAILKKSADLSNDVDKYIQVVKLEKNSICSDDICDISERLIAASRFKEAIIWLSGIDDEDHRSGRRDRLLVSTYHNKGNIKEAQKMRWKIFQKRCYFDNYDEYIEHLNNESIDHIREKAIKVAESAEYLSCGVGFLDELKEYDKLESLILCRYDEVRNDDYHTYRKLSTLLAKQGKYLVSSLLRRKLAEGGVLKVQTKYYRYAASDYKKCNDYAKKVSNWGDFDTHDVYLAGFQERHKRKKAFWALLPS